MVKIVDVEHGVVVGKTMMGTPKTKTIYHIYDMDNNKSWTTYNFDTTKHNCKYVGRVGSRDRYVCYD